MLQFVQTQILLCLSMILLLFLPGYFLLLAIEGRNRLFSQLERFAASFGLSIVLADFLMIFMGKIGIGLSRISIMLALGITIASLLLIFHLRRTGSKPISTKNAYANLFTFSKSQGVLIVLILFLTIFIKTIYLSDAIFPTSTDLGHHMYWSKLTVQTGALPEYEESEIVLENGNYSLSDPNSIADFIIGEHLIFSALHLLSGADFISSFPSLVLFLINLMGVFSFFILTLRLFQKYPFGSNAAIFALFLAGPLYAIASPQAKYISGGVVGNLIGNLLIPLALYFYFRALREKNSWFFALAIFVTAGLFYTHHLSAFVFLFVFVFIFAIFSAFNISRLFDFIKQWAKLIFSSPVLAFFIFYFLFFIFLYVPNYIDTNAVETAVGGPSKSSRAGLSFSQLKFSAGEARMALGIAGLALLLLLRRRKSYAHALLLGWTGAFLVMSLKPHWLFLDIPSGRIANYISLPLAATGAFALGWFLHQLQGIKLNSKGVLSYFAAPVFILLLTFISSSGFYDNSQSLGTKTSAQEALQTFRASEYLGANTSENDLVLKDHNYLAADAWIKLSFMRGYNYPLSRGLFSRYEDVTKKREMCTLWMISTPNTADGQKCFNDTGTNFVMVNSRVDGTQFEQSKDFWKLYDSDGVSIFYRE